MARLTIKAQTTTPNCPLFTLRKAKTSENKGIESISRRKKVQRKDGHFEVEIEEGQEGCVSNEA